jgi:hypothetical protein
VSIQNEDIDYPQNMYSGVQHRVFGFSSSFVPFDASFSELSNFDCPSVFSNVYLY